MMTIQEYINECLASAADELFKYVEYMQEEEETAQS